MKIPVIFIAAAVAVGASRPPHIYNSGYYDSLPYFESSVSPPFLRSSYSKQESFFKNSQPTRVNDDLLKDGPLSHFQEDRKLFDFPPFTSSDSSFHKPHSFYQDGLSSFRQDQFNAQDYRGPPPPIPKEYFRKQMLHSQDERFYNSSQPQSTKVQMEHISQQPTTTEYRLSHPSERNINHVDHENHGLGFASIVGVTSPDINPLIVAEVASTTKAAAESPTPIAVHSITTNDVHISHQKQKQQHQHPAMHTLNSEIFTPIEPTTPASKINSDFPYIQTTSNVERTLNDLVLTTPATTKMTSVMPQSNLASIQNPSSKAAEIIRTFSESPKSSYDISVTSQEFPVAAHEQLTIKPLEQKMHVPHVKQNLFLYETKNNFPFQPSHLQIHKKHYSNDNVTPLRFSIPTVSTSVSFPSSTTSNKFVRQNLDFSRSTLPLIADSNTNNYNADQNQFYRATFEKLNSVNNLGSNIPSYYFLQNNDQLKFSAQMNSDKPLETFYLLQNDGLSRHGPESKFDISLGNIGRKEYLQPSNNFLSSRSTAFGIENLGLSFQEPLKLSESMYAKIGLNQGPW